MVQGTFPWRPGGPEHCVLRFDAVEATFYIDEESITSHCGAGSAREVPFLPELRHAAFGVIGFSSSFAPVLCALAGIKLDRWWKWMVPLFILLILTQMILIAIAMFIGWA